MSGLSHASSPASSALILASASPRRRELLTQLAIPFTVIPAHIDEQPYPAEVPHAYVVRVAQAKAQHVAQQCPAAVVLGADTVVILDHNMLGKPRSVDHARQMLSQLSGRQHTVITGLAVIHHAQHFLRCDTVRTLVGFRALTPADIEGYLATGEPFDKAGSYAVQGIGGAFVASLEGCYTNVVGLPVRRTTALLRAAGLCPAESR